MIATITTCKRPELFKKTVDSFSLLKDWNLVEVVGCFDDGSEYEQLKEMQEPFDAIWHTLKEDEVGGHANSMRKICKTLSSSERRFFIHLEDDFPFIQSGCPILAAMDVMLNNPTIGQVMFGREEMAFPRVRRTPSGTEYTIRPMTFGAENLPAFTLNPGLQRIQAWLTTGNFEDVPRFEREYGERWNKAGWRTADLVTPFVMHIGDKSAYEIQGRTR
jgi:hypothetical protein